MLLIISIRLFLSSFIMFDTWPFSWFMDIFLDISVFASIKFIIPSAWVKSILPFRKALLVNSPGSASLAPFDSTSSRTLLVVLIPPWQFISIISSLVNVFGDSITLTNTSSIISLLSMIWP